MMDSSLAIPLGDMPELQNFFNQMEKRGLGANADDIEKLITYVDDMERNFSELMDEVVWLRERVQDLHGKSLQGKIEHLSLASQQKIEIAKEQLGEVKNQIASGMKNSVEKMKEGSIKAADKIIDVLKVKTVLGKLSASLRQTSISLKSSIEKIETIRTEYAEIRKHKQNVHNILNGKEVSNIDLDNKNKGVLTKIQNSMKYCKKLAECMEKSTISMTKTVDGLSERAQTYRDMRGEPAQKTVMQPKSR